MFIKLSKKQMVLALEDTMKTIKATKMYNKEFIEISIQLLIDDICATFGSKVPYKKWNSILTRFEDIHMKYGDLSQWPIY